MEARKKIGILLINLGTPEATSYFPMRRYLGQFLSDPRVIETNRLLWWPILHGLILSVRPQKSGKNYAKIWNREKNESPLKTITRSQAHRLGTAFNAPPFDKQFNADIMFDWGMRYGLPPLGERLKALREAGCERILLFPLYPQYAAATTATALDEAYRTLQKMRWQPSIRTMPPYYDHPAYINALALTARDDLALLGWQPDMMLLSYHGIPVRTCQLGDPYYQHCLATTQRLQAALHLPNCAIKMVFQSRFGRQEWLKPYAQETVIALAQSGVKNLAMLMPGFAADCIETLEEIALGLREIFLENGGINFSALPCLNDRPTGIKLMQELIAQELAGWV